MIRPEIPMTQNDLGPGEAADRARERRTRIMFIALAAVGGAVGFTAALHAGQLVLQHRFAVDQQAADECALAVVDRAAGDEAQGGAGVGSNGGRKSDGVHRSCSRDTAEPASPGR